MYTLHQEVVKVHIVSLIYILNKLEEQLAVHHLGAVCSCLHAVLTLGF